MQVDYHLQRNELGQKTCWMNTMLASNEVRARKSIVKSTSVSSMLFRRKLPICSNRHRSHVQNSEGATNKGVRASLTSGVASLNVHASSALDQLALEV